MSKRHRPYRQPAQADTTRARSLPAGARATPIPAAVVQQVNNQLGGAPQLPASLQPVAPTTSNVVYPNTQGGPSQLGYTGGMNVGGLNAAPIDYYRPAPRPDAGSLAARPGIVPFGPVAMPPGDPLRPAIGLDDGYGGPRSWDFPALVNITAMPRQTEGVAFSQLRNLSRLYDGVQIAVRVILRILDRLELQVVPHPDYLTADGQETADDKWLGPARAMRDWLAEPRADWDLHAWMRGSMRELLELDALGIYHEQTRGGSLYGLRMVTGDSLVRLQDTTGNVPSFPDPAFLQIVHGAPGWMGTAREMDYLRLQDRVDSLYGSPPVEALLLTVNEALRKAHYDLSIFTDGSTPEGVMETDNPALFNTTADQVLEFERAWNAVLAGNDQIRVRTKFSPPGFHWKPTKPYSFDSQLDRWVLNKTAACFGLTMDEMAITDTSNRSTGQSQQDVVYRNAVQPYTLLFARYLSRVVQRYAGKPLSPREQSVSYAGAPTKGPAKWDGRFIVQFGGVEEPEDWNQKAFALNALTKSGIIGPTEVKKLLKLPILPDEKHVGAYVLAPAGMDSVVFLNDLLEQQKNVQEAHAAQLDAKTQQAQQQVQMGQEQTKQAHLTTQQQQLQNQQLGHQVAMSALQVQAAKEQHAQAQQQGQQQAQGTSGGQPGQGQAQSGQQQQQRPAPQSQQRPTGPQGPGQKQRDTALVGGTTTAKAPGAQVGVKPQQQEGGNKGNANGNHPAARGQALAGSDGDGGASGWNLAGWRTTHGLGTALDDAGAVGIAGGTDRPHSKRRGGDGDAGTGAIAGPSLPGSYVRGATGTARRVSSNLDGDGDGNRVGGDAGRGAHIPDNDARQAPTGGDQRTGTGPRAPGWGESGRPDLSKTEGPADDAPGSAIRGDDGIAGSAGRRSGVGASQAEAEAEADPEALRDEWRAWREKALRAVKRGQVAPPFAPVAISEVDHAWVSERLVACTTADEVRSVFEQQRERESQREAERAEATKATPLAAPDDDAHTGIMIAFMVPQEVAQQLAQRRDEDLRLGDDIHREKSADMHVTLAYLGDKTDPAWTPAKLRQLPRVVSDFAADRQPFDGRVASLGRFHNGGKDPTGEGDAVHAVVESEGLQQFRKALVSTLKDRDLPVDETFKDYKPHVTLAYIPPDEPTPPIELPADASLPFQVVTVAIGDEHSHHALGTEQNGNLMESQRAAQTPQLAPDSLAQLAAALTARLADITTDEIRALRADVVKALTL